MAKARWAASKAHLIQPNHTTTEGNMSIHLATFNVFREEDGSLWVTCADASGVKAELGESSIPTYPMAMKALYEAVRQMQHRSSGAQNDGKNL